MVYGKWEQADLLCLDFYQDGNILQQQDVVFYILEQASSRNGPLERSVSYAAH